jgi:hypothetical protein
MRRTFRNAAILLTLSILVGCRPALPTEIPSIPEAEVPITESVATEESAATEVSAASPTTETEPAPQSEVEAENVFTFSEMGIIVGFDFPNGIDNTVNTSVEEVYEVSLPFELPYPQNARILFSAYPGDSAEILSPAIRVFRSDDINALEAGVLDNLKAVLDGQTDHHVDFPRLAGAGSVIDAQLIPVDFKNGTGYRYLITKSFSADPLSSTTMTYLYQGITNDEKYFVSFIIKVDAPFLGKYIGKPLTSNEEFASFYGTINQLIETSNGDQFSPSLNALDELIQSLVVIEK